MVRESAVYKATEYTAYHKQVVLIYMGYIYEIYFTVWGHEHNI